MLTPGGKRVLASALGLCILGTIWAARHWRHGSSVPSYPVPAEAEPASARSAPSPRAADEPRRPSAPLSPASTLAAAAAAPRHTDEPDAGAYQVVRTSDGKIAHVFGDEFAPARTLSVAALLEKDKPAMDTIQKGIGPGSVPSRRQDACYADWMKRPHQLISARMEWNVTVAVVARAGTAHITEVDVPDQDWPVAFDAPLERCILDSYRDVSFPAEHDFEVTLDFPLCIYGPQAKGD